MGRIGTGGNALARCPQHRIVVVGIGKHILERILLLFLLFLVLGGFIGTRIACGRAVIGIVVGIGAAARRFGLFRLLGLFVAQLVYRQSSGDLAGREQQSLSGLAVGFGDEAQTLGGNISLNFIPEFTGVYVVDKLYLFRLAYIVDHDSAYALKGYKGVGLAAHNAGDDALGLGALLAGTVVLLDIFVGTVEIFGKLCRGDLLKIAAAVVFQKQAVVRRLVNGEGAAAEDIILIGIQTVPHSGIEPDNFFFFAKLNFAAWRSLVLDLIVQPFPIGTAVAFIGGENIGLSAHNGGGYAVRHPYAVNTAVIPNLDITVLLQIDLAAAVILETQRMNADEILGGDIQHGNSVGFLQRYICFAAGNGYVFRLKVGGGLSVFLYESSGGGQNGSLIVKFIKINDFGCHGVVGGYGHDADGALGICSVHASSGLSFIGGKYGIVVRKDEHVGLNSDIDGPTQFQGTIAPAGKQNHYAVCCVVILLNCHGQLAAVGRNGHGGHIFISEALKRSCNQCFNIVFRAVQIHDRLAA